MEEEKMALTITEKQAVQKYQSDIKDILAAIGSMRRQFTRSEMNLLQKVDSVESEFMNHLKMLAKNRGMSEDEDWVFNPETFEFVKR